MKIRTKRVHDPPAESDGVRVLVDRLWPRGLSREAVACDAWVRDIAPSTELRRWFAHDPVRWRDFRSRYRAELDARPDSIAELANLAGAGDLTLLYAARDRDHNQATVLREYLEEFWAAEGS